MYVVKFMLLIVELLWCGYVVMLVFEVEGVLLVNIGDVYVCVMLYGVIE